MLPFQAARFRMVLHVFVVLLLVCLLFSLALLWRLYWFRLQPSSSKGGAKRTTLQRLLKPQTPDDCPACHLVSPPSSALGPAPVRPWREVKSRRGAPNRIDTQGFACPNQQCTYFGITDAQMHALVGDGTHGRAEPIQTFHFGQWREVGHRGRKVLRWRVAADLIYGQVKKSERRRKLVRVTPVMRLGTEADLKVALQRLGLSGRLNTAFIERVNLTIRHGVAGLARRTWATAQPTPHLLAHLEWWRASYHFVRPHASLRVRLVQPRERGGRLVAQRDLQRTPAMAAGKTNRRWTAREVLSCPLPPVCA